MSRDFPMRLFWMALNFLLMNLASLIYVERNTWPSFWNGWNLFWCVFSNFEFEKVISKWFELLVEVLLEKFLLLKWKQPIKSMQWKLFQNGICSKGQMSPVSERVSHHCIRPSPIQGTIHNAFGLVFLVSAHFIRKLTSTNRNDKTSLSMVPLFLRSHPYRTLI